MLKERLPADLRVPFEVSFWTIRDANKDDKEFLDKIDGKTPNEIIAMGQELYQQRKSSAYQGYDKYASWEDMISKYNQERSEQDSRQGLANKKEDARDKANDVLYNLQ